MPFEDIAKAHVVLHALSKFQAAPVPQYEFDVSEWRDPVGNAILRHLSGRDVHVQEYLMADHRYHSLLSNVKMLVKDIVGQQKSNFLSIGFRDFHGRHISLGLIYLIGAELDKEGYSVCIHDLFTPLKPATP